MAARHGDLAVLAVSDEQRRLDRGQHEDAVLAPVDGDLRHVVENEHVAVLQVIDLEHASFQIARFLDQCLSLLLLEDQIGTFALLFNRGSLGSLCGWLLLYLGFNFLFFYWLLLRRLDCLRWFFFRRFEFNFFAFCILLFLYGFRFLLNWLFDFGRNSFYLLNDCLIFHLRSRLLLDLRLFDLIDNLFLLLLLLLSYDRQVQFRNLDFGLLFGNSVEVICLVAALENICEALRDIWALVGRRVLRRLNGHVLLGRLDFLGLLLRELWLLFTFLFLQSSLLFARLDDAPDSVVLDLLAGQPFEHISISDIPEALAPMMRAVFRHFCLHCIC